MLRDEGPLWYKDAILYEVPVRAFADSNGDGWGDFKGLVSKLDYLQDLGVTALWLLPFYPSPLRDDGYDIADYTNIHPRYGTLADFKLLLREAHRRGLRVITEMVVNHTSDQHPWFQRARHARPGDPARDFYVWSDTDTKFREARIIFKDFESSNWTWDPAAGAFYWHRFYHHQPDLNFDNPAVWKAVLGVLDFWLELGIDGLRLDAIPYLYEREGTHCENLPETHAFLRALRRHVDEKFPNRVLLAEANQWPEDAVAYFGRGDECHMAFHFPVMPRLFMGIRMEDRLPILDILQQTPAIPANCQWAMFLRNHDELTLEMVTDEDRDYMYRVYARDPQARINLGIRRRLAPLLENQRPKIELMNALLLSLPGTPVLYYGDEIGMGDNIYLGDRNGVRTPMQWTGDRNAGFSRANPQALYLPVIIDPEYHFEAVNVEVQQNNPHSLLWWTKRLLDLRKRHKAFGRGSLRFVTPANHKVLAFVRGYAPKQRGTEEDREREREGERERGELSVPVPLPVPVPDSASPAEEDTVLVVANLSRFPQFVELDLSAFQGQAPVELQGRTPFPVIAERPYVLTLGPYQFYWFALQPQHAGADGAGPGPALRPTLEVPEKWENVFLGDAKGALEDRLPGYLQTCPWFANRAAQIEAAMVLETIPVPCPGGPVQVALVQVEYSEGDPETYVLPLAFATGPGAEHVRADRPWAVVGPLRVQPRQPSGHEPESGVLYDPLGERPFSVALLEAMLRHRRFKRSAGELLALPVAATRAAGNGQKNGELPPADGGADGRAARPARAAEATAGVAAVGPTLLHSEQRNTSVVFGDRYILKVYRRIEDGINPEVEAGRFLVENTAFRAVPRLLGMLEYRRGWGEPMTLAVLHEYVPHQSDGWHYCQDALGRFFEHALSHPARAEELAVPPRTPLELAAAEVPPLAQEGFGPLLEPARLLGLRTGELHLALASRPEVAAFAPEPFTTLYQRSLYQALRNQVRQTFLLLHKSLEALPEDVRADARELGGREDALLQQSRAIYQRKLAAQRIRVHGDYNLREVLYTGRDFVIIDFEGVPTRPLSDRRRKYTPLRDVASMVRSFHYAALFALHHGVVRHEDRPALAPWANLWYAWMSAAFLKGYLEAAGRGGLLPEAPEELELLFDFYLVKRALGEVRFGLTRSPDRAAVPVRGLLQVLDTLRARHQQHA